MSDLAPAVFNGFAGVWVFSPGGTARSTRDCLRGSDNPGGRAPRVAQLVAAPHLFFKRPIAAPHLCFHKHTRSECICS